MAGNKYLSNNAGALTEVVAVQSSAGAGDAGKIPALDAGGKFDASMMPTGVGAETVAVTASEALADGDFVNIWNNSGTANARKADASTSGKEANGFVLAGVSSSATATVYMPSQANAHLTSLTQGTKYFLSDSVPGGVTTTAPSGSGKTVQYLGTSSSTTTIVFNPRDPIVLA